LQNIVVKLRLGGQGEFYVVAFLVVGRLTPRTEFVYNAEA
jgi:hypothetical protein